MEDNFINDLLKDAVQIGSDFTKSEKKQMSIEDIKAARSARSAGQKIQSKNIITQFDFNCDWLQLHLYLSTDLQDYPKGKFLIKRTGQSKVFRDIYEITNLLGYPLASWATNANECIMDKGHGVLKFDNKQLYVNADLKKYVSDFLHHFAFKFIGITRLDICFDFHEFENFRAPQNFIKDFLCSRILKKNNTKFLSGGTHEKLTYNESISFGSKQSSVYYKLYNKSREMLAKTLKPHIVNSWKSTKLDVENKEIWRLEFTLNADTSTLLNDYNQTFKYHSLETLELPNMYGIFVYLFQKHFNFVKKKNISRKDRMAPVVLFTLPLTHLKIDKINTNIAVKDSTRSTKIFIKKMFETNEDLRKFDDHFSVDAKNMVEKLINIYGLEKWAQSKNFDFNLNNYSQNISDLITSTL